MTKKGLGQDLFYVTIPNNKEYKTFKYEEELS